jgi:hypothetical protein
MENEIGNSLGGFITNTVLPLAVAIAIALVNMVLLAIKKRLGLQFTVESESLLRTEAEQAVQMVAERAAKTLKHEGIKLPANSKLNAAVKMLTEKVPALTQQQAADLVHAALARIRGLGSTGDETFVPKQ